MPIASSQQPIGCMFCKVKNCPVLNKSECPALKNIPITMVPVAALDSGGEFILN